MGYVSIAIDGPSGAGKSTMAKKLAKRLGFVYADTGAIYRCVGLFAVENGLKASEVKEHLDKIQIEIRYDESGTQKMLLCGRDVSERIRMPDISIAASDVSAVPEIRAFLLQMQRNIAENSNVIMDGRDIGTVVLPEATLKVFLTASAQERAKRRVLELDAKGVKTSYEEVLEDMRYRDENDSNRQTAPLRCAKDAVMLDTTDKSAEEVLDILSKLAGEKI